MESTTDKESVQGVYTHTAEEVFHYMFQSAQNGSTDGECGLAYCYKQGLGVQRSEEQAVHWYYLASKHGHPYAPWYLANCEADGYPMDDQTREYAIACGRDWIAKHSNIVHAPTSDCGCALAQKISE